MVPKVIHYCWFGRNPKPELMQRCIKSWRKCCPDYEIVEWNEDNFDISQNNYAREAYEEKKWAFVTDYARLWIIYNHGGVYLDTDVELIKPLDSLLASPAFFGLEDSGYIATGLGFGAEKGNEVVFAMLKDYDGIHFRLADGSLDKLPCPVRNTKAIKGLLNNGLHVNEITKAKSAWIYPPEYFCPLSADGANMRKTPNTYSIHWFSATWLTDDELTVHKYRVFRNKCEKRLGKRLGGFAARFTYLFLPQKRKVLKRM